MTLGGARPLHGSCCPVCFALDCRRLDVPMAKTRPLPDPDVSLRDARDFIVSTALARKALRCRWNLFPVALHDLVEVIHRLVQSCHLPEFTDHGLPHLCS